MSIFLKAQPDEFVLVTYGPGEFIGEIGLLTGQRVYLTGVVSAPSRILRIPVEHVHTIMDQELELSELILRAFLVRHARLTRLGSGLTLVGSRFDVNTRRLLEVLSRNRLSSKWLDLEGEPEAEALLRRLNVPVADLPIVVVPGGELLRNPSSRALLDALGLSAGSRQWRSCRGLRPARRRRWTGGTPRGRLRRIGGFYQDHDARGGYRARRPGRNVFAHRELPGIPSWIVG